MNLLHGIRILEMAVEPPANTATALLADLGAEVIKVERPPTGDFTREVGSLDPELRVSAFHLTLSRNKKSLTLDVRNPSGKQVFFDLVKTCDAVLQVSAPGTPARLGIDFEHCQEAKPDIVYVSLSGYGESGPYVHNPAHGATVDAFLGTIAPTRRDDGRLTFVKPEGNPGNAVTGNGVFAAIALLAGLAHRANTGEGSYLETSMVDAVVFWRYLDVFSHCNPYERLRPLQTGAGAARYNYYECADGKFVMFGAIERKFWLRFCDAVGRPDLAERGDWAFWQDFGGGDSKLEDELTSIFLTRPRAHWMKLLSHQIPLMPGNTFGELLDDEEYVESRQLVVRYDHPGFGPVALAGNPVKWPGHPQRVEPAPEMGQHNDEVLRGLGYDDSTIRRLRDEGVIFGPYVPGDDR